MGGHELGAAWVILGRLANLLFCGTHVYYDFPVIHFVKDTANQRNGGSDRYRYDNDIRQGNTIIEACYFIDKAYLFSRSGVQTVILDAENFLRKSPTLKVYGHGPSYKAQTDYSDGFHKD